MCTLFGISKNTYYTAQDPDERYSQKYQHLKQYIQQVITDNPGYGIRRLKQELLNTRDIHIGRDAVARLLKLWGLDLQRTTKTIQPSMLQKILKLLANKTNLVARIKPVNPFEALSSDITQLQYKNGVAYLCVHKDIIGQMVYGFAVSSRMTTQLVITSLQMALRQITPVLVALGQRLLVHQDRGSQYTSYEYVGELHKHNCIISYSAPGTPTDNAGMESFFGRFKDEWASEILDLETIDQVERYVAEKMWYYTSKRLHTSLNYTSPLQFTKSYLQSLNIQFSFSRT